MDPKNPKFKALQKQWYEKLKNSGFQDIEDTETENLKTYSSPKSTKSARYQTELYREKYNYRFYTLCRQLLHDEKFLKATEKFPHHREVWALHSEGVVQRLIAERTKRSVAGVKQIINKYLPMIKESNSEAHDEPDSD